MPTKPAQNTPRLVGDAMPVACFAPPLSDELLAVYSARIEALPLSELKDALQECLKPVKIWWELPESRVGPDKPKLKLRHRGRDVTVVIRDLEPQFQEALFEAIPWPTEIKGIQTVFDAIDAGPANKDLRDMAFHLLWHVVELNNDREPLTQAALPGS